MNAMHVFVKPDGSKESNHCSLCNCTRKVGLGVYPYGEEPECPWCHAVKMKYGSYWYPVDETNKHLFENKSK